ALLLRMLADADLALADPVTPVPAQALVDPVAVPALGLVRRDEELHLHLLELTDAEEEVARRDLVPERLADLRDPERRLPAGDLQDILEVDEDSLGRLRAQERARGGVLDGADVRL